MFLTQGVRRRGQQTRDREVLRSVRTRELRHYHAVVRALLRVRRG